MHRAGMSAAVLTAPWLYLLSLTACGGGPSQAGRDGGPCTATTCQARSVTCGAIADGCGGTLTCGAPCFDPLGVGDAIAAGQAACAAAPLAGTVYYFCDCFEGGRSGFRPHAACATVIGDDARDGVTPGTARRSWDAVVARWNTLLPGETIALCRGGAWDTGSTSASNLRRNDACWAGRSNGTCLMRDYTPAGLAGAERPVLVGSRPPEPRGPLDFSSGASTHGNYSFHNLAFTTADTGGTVAHVFGYGDVRDVDLCDNLFDGAGAAVQLNGGDNCAVADATCASGWTFRFNRVQNQYGQGWLGGASDLDLAFNDFERAGGASNRDHAIYVTGGRLSNRNMRIRGNRARRSAMVGGTQCLGVVIVVHDWADGLAITGNLLEEPDHDAGSGCYGIGVSTSGEGKGEWLRNVLIAGNVLKDLGNTGIDVNASQDVVIENNVVYQSRSEQMVGIAASAFVAAGDTVASNVTVRNNTLYYGSAGTNESVGVVIQDGVQGDKVIANNVAYGTTGFFGNGGAFPGCFYPQDGTGPTFAGNRCANEGAPAATALWTAPDDVDFSLAPGSPLAGAGSTVSYPATNILGAARTAPPSQGAY